MKNTIWRDVDYRMVDSVLSAIEEMGMITKEHKRTPTGMKVVYKWREMPIFQTKSLNRLELEVKELENKYWELYRRHQALLKYLGLREVTPLEVEAFRYHFIETDEVEIRCQSQSKHS